MADPTKGGRDEGKRPASSGRSEQGELAGWYRMAGVGTEFIAAVAVFGGVGYGLDRWLGTSPWLLLSGCGLGFAVGLWLMYRAASKTFL